MKWGKLSKVVVLSLTAVVVVAAIFLAVVVRSRPQFRFRFLEGHKPLGSGMDRYFVDTDLDVYSWQEPWTKVEERIRRELPRWKRTELGELGILFQFPDGTYVAVSKGMGEYPVNTEYVDNSPDWVTIKIWKDVPENLVSEIRLKIEDWKGNHYFPSNF